MIERIYLLSAFLLIFGACGQKENEIKFSNSMPEQMIEKFNMTDRVGGEVVWELNADKAEIFESKGKVSLYKPYMYFYENQEISSIISSKSGNYDQKKEILELWGSVLIDSQKDEMTIETDRVFYDANKEKIYSDEAVEIKRPGSITKGVGFESDSGLNVIEIKNNKTEVECNDEPEK